MVSKYKDKIAPQPYDPNWLVELLKRQLPEETELINSAKNCTTLIGFCGCGCGDPYFIDPKSIEWNFDYNEVLERKDGVEVIIDVMKNKTIGSIEIGEWDKKQ